MNAAAVLNEAQAAGVELAATPGGLIRYRSPGPLPEALRQKIITFKAEVLALLRVSTCACGRPLDGKRRCWKCCDRLCACGRTTGSAFIELCVACGNRLNANESQLGTKKALPGQGE
jgi:hypothetical protein